jgi:hypothetical protein
MLRLTKGGGVVFPVKDKLKDLPLISRSPANSFNTTETAAR